jgi:hypothetical protein
LTNELTRKFCRELRSRGHLFVLPNFYINDWECDIFSITTRGYTNEYEIKISKADFENDKYKSYKPYRGETQLKSVETILGKRTSKFWYVFPSSLNLDIPSYAGIITYRDGIFHNIREAPFMNKTKVDLSNKLLFNIANKCYNRYIQLK